MEKSIILNFIISFSAFGRVQRTFGKIRATLNTGFNYNKINQFIQDRRSVNESFTQTYTPALRTNFKIAPNVGIEYKYSVSKNSQGNNQTNFYTISPSINFDAYIWKSLTFVTDYSFTSQRRAGRQENSFETWDASIAYRKDKDSKWEYALKATNILDNEVKVDNIATNLFVSSVQTFIQPRFLTLRIIYNL
ncbi:hypothetical protein [Christiangramia forsetii]|uniref:TonB-dependent outer membrane receptor n=2 Tax=Christiangramia forsetii TaxID=411153 RepID=A0M4P0_CHRFK|nr:hypothetical protein [Christiangramia forsetii]GGG22979.1 hypothetical protein GCM10011532_02610 [Christiangramia forsetii]CAL67585.1 conserved hypothetical protein [Christiangramia forsetii KT0803]